jgi:hypothetical protein
MMTERRSGSDIEGSNGYDRLPEWQGHVILPAKHWDQAVKVAQLLEGNSRRLSEAGIDPPAQGSHQIEIEHMLYAEPGLFHQGAQALLGVSPLVSQLAIERSE